MKIIVFISSKSFLYKFIRLSLKGTLYELDVNFNDIILTLMNDRSWMWIILDTRISGMVGYTPLHIDDMSAWHLLHGKKSLKKTIQ